MGLPETIGLPLAEATALLAAQGLEWTLTPLLAPRQRLEDCQGEGCTAYVVRQRQLSEHRVALAIVYRVRKGGVKNGFED